MIAQQKEAIRQQAESKLQSMSSDEIDAKIKELGLTRAPRRKLKQIRKVSTWNHI
jgi:hypothetical protein